MRTDTLSGFPTTLAISSVHVMPSALGWRRGRRSGGARRPAPIQLAASDGRGRQEDRLARLGVWGRRPARRGPHRPRARDWAESVEHRRLPRPSSGAPPSSGRERRSGRCHQPVRAGRMDPTRGGPCRLRPTVCTLTRSSTSRPSRSRRRSRSRTRCANPGRELRQLGVGANEGSVLPREAMGMRHSRSLWTSLDPDAWYRVPTHAGRHRSLR